MPGQLSAVYPPSSYTTPIHPEHLEPTIIEPGERMRRAMQRSWQHYVELWSEPSSNGDDLLTSLRGAAMFADVFIQQIPGGYELTRDVDDGGNTRLRHEPAMFTPWIEAEDTGVFVRMSESRTAKHGRSLLRSPVMAGIAIEYTNDPSSVSPADAHTAFILQRESEAPSWSENQDPRPAAAFDLSEFMEDPLFVGPLYGGHPNRVPGGIRQQHVVDLTRYLFDSLADTKQIVS